MCLLAYWRTGLLVLVQGSWYYVYVSYATNAGTNGPQPAAATTKKLRPGRGRPRHKKRAAAGRNCGRPRLCGRLRPTGPDVMHWYLRLKQGEGELRQTVYWNRLLYCWTGTVLQPSRSTTTVLLQRLLSCSFTLSTLLQRPLHR